MNDKIGEWSSSAVSGLATLGLLQVLSPWLGFALPLGVPSFVVTMLLGFPGVIALLLLRWMFLL